MKTHITTAALLLASLSLANAQLFDFFGVGDNTNSDNELGAAVSGTVEVNAVAGSIKFTINNLSDGGGTYPYADLVAFGFWNDPDALAPFTGYALTENHTDSWTGTNSSVLFVPSNSYYGANSDGNQGFMNSGLNGGESAMFTFSGASESYLNALVSEWTNDGVVSNNRNDQHDVRFRFMSIGGDDGDSDSMFLELRPVPEPSTYGLIGAGALVLLVAARRFKRK